MAIKAMPPKSSAPERKRHPKIRPILTPENERTKVTAAIIKEACRISTFKKPKETPAARASMLVATERGNIIEDLKDGSEGPSFFLDSAIILMPIKERRINAIQ